MYQYATRVYYEDTDAGGIVYHANYLKFMERCRCEWLDDLGYSVVRLQQDYGVNFVVADASLKFHAPGKLFDSLTVSCQILQLRKVQMTLQQKIYNGEELLCTGVIKLATLDQASFKLVALPDALCEAIENKRNRDD